MTSDGDYGAFVLFLSIIGALCWVSWYWPGYY